MANLRKGEFGYYYGSFFGESEPLNKDEKEINALYIRNYLHAQGWSVQAIAGILGNMESESTMNPGRWQSNDIGNYSGGYGLVQWTPASKYIDWCFEKGIAPEDMDSNLSRIIYEVENRIQWIATDSYDFSFSTFTTSTEDPYYLACAFAWNYERSYVVLYGREEEQEALRQKRGGYARSWYEYLGGEVPDDPDPDPEPDEPLALKSKKYNFLLFTANKRRQLWTRRNF